LIETSLSVSLTFSSGLLMSDWKFIRSFAVDFADFSMPPGLLYYDPHLILPRLYTIF
jgi:hypothetical protein